MSSLGSLPFVMDAKAEGFLLLPAINPRGPRFLFAEYRPKKSLEFTGSSDSTLGFLKLKAAGEDGAKLYGSSERGAVVVRSRVTKKGSMEDGDSESEDAIQTWLSALGWVEDGDSESEEVVSPETIEKRNKILAKHRELLSSAMIFEAEHCSVTGQENLEVSCEGSDTTFPTQSSGSTSEDALSSNYVHSSADEVPEFLHSPVSGSFNMSEKEPATAASSKQTPLGGRSSKRVTNGCAFTPLIPKMEGKQDFIESGLNEPKVEDVKPLAGDNVMNIIFVAAECAPWSKTGGLGDVAGALPKALARRGHRVMVVAPRYGIYAEARNLGVKKMYKVDGQDMEVVYYQAFIDGVDFVFMDSPMFRHLENNIYGGNRMDILKRMVLFCKAAVEVPWHVPCGGVCYGDGNLVFIANDWHTALLPVYLKAYYRENRLMTFARSVLVIHNIAHQGRGPVDDFRYVDLPPHYLDHFKMYDPVGGEHFNIIKAGLIAADRVVTVSRGYAWELKTSEGGWGLHGIISENSWKLIGIVNGIDAKEWSPEVDSHLTSDGYTNYSLMTLQTGKPRCKAALQKELGLPIRKDVPLIGFIGRLDGQKGVDIIAEAIPWMMKQDVQLVMLGTGRCDLEEMVKRLENQHKGNIKGCVGFCVKTSHRITAGADILLMPSRFEPCGLNQLYAMSYGTVPVVHAVGGLRDTVVPFDPFNESGLGWTFDSADSKKLIRALYYCLLTYRKYKKSWEGLQRRGMMQDLSWDNVAHRYEEVLVAAKYQW